MLPACRLVRFALISALVLYPKKYQKDAKAQTKKLTTVARSKFKPLSARPVARVALMGEGNAVKNRIVLFFLFCTLYYCADINPIRLKKF
jgi:hypothetical protein